jgi:hypothetical protein
MIAARPSTPVVAAARGRVPLYEVPVIPTLPVAHGAVTISLPSTVVNPRARPFNQSITAFGASDSFIPPTVGHPSDNPVPGDSECTTAKPRGTQLVTCELEILGRVLTKAIAGCDVRGGGGAPTSCFTSQRNSRGPDVPAK